MDVFITTDTFIKAYPEFKNAGITVDVVGNNAYVYDSSHEHIGNVDIGGNVTLTEVGKRLLSRLRY